MQNQRWTITKITLKREKGFSTRYPMMSHKHPPLLKKFRWLMYISLTITVLSLILLLHLCRSYMTFDFWTPNSGASSEPEIPAQPTVPKHCGPGRVVQLWEKVSFVPVHGTKTLLVSAYQEHRTGTKEVRVIAVVLRSESVVYRCLFCCEEHLHISNGYPSIHSDHFNFKYGTADIMCPLPSGCESPSHVTVTSAANTEGLPEFLEVKNQEKKSYAFPYHFTVCLSTMFDFDNVLQLVQSLEVLQLLGVDRVVIYKTSSSPETQCILDYYTNKGLVEVIPWPLSIYLNVSRGWLPEHGPGEIHYLGQIPALNDCLYRYMYRSKYMALHDIDELILPQSVNSWSDLLPLLEEKYGTNECYMFENNVFPNTINMTPPVALSLPSSWQNVPRVNILDHLYQEPVTEQTRHENYKIIINPRIVFSLTVHGLLDPETGYACSWVDRNIARMYHTRFPRQPELTSDKLIYDGRLLNYSARFTPRVNIVLTECGLLPKDNMK